jgi:septin family protein
MTSDPVTFRAKLKQLGDKRVHLVLYFFGGGHTIRAADFKAIDKLAKVANVLPVVSLADTFTADELRDYKHRILADASAHRVNFFNCEAALLDMLGDLSQISKKLLTSATSGPCPPFAIVNP